MRKNVCLQNEIPSFVQKSFIAANTDLPRFYHLIKTHKTGPVIKIFNEFTPKTAITILGVYKQNMRANKYIAKFTKTNCSFVAQKNSYDAKKCQVAFGTASIFYFCRNGV